MIPVINLREIDKKRLRNLKDRAETNLKSEDVWFVHTVLAQCFLPYHDPKTERWHKKNGAFSILLTAGAIEDKERFRVLGLPFGAKRPKYRVAVIRCHMRLHQLREAI